MRPLIPESRVRPYSDSPCSAPGIRVTCWLADSGLAGQVKGLDWTEIDRRTRHV
jgi:hypothetical protein